MVSCLFVLLIACSIAYAAFGNANTLSTKLSSAKTYKQYATLDFPGQTPTVKVATKAKASPTSRPVAEPTGSPIAVPTVSPTAKAKASPTARPVAEPTDSPIAVPTDAPIAEPTVSPTPKAKASPTARPVGEPTANPIVDPTIAPTFLPSEQPIAQPTANPIVDPTIAPTFLPSEQPIAVPTYAPTFKPSELPTNYPVAVPTLAPTRRQISCKVIMIIIRVAIWWYRHNPHGCNSVLKAAIVAAIKGLAIGDIQDPLVTEAILAVENGHLRVSVQDDAPEAISVEYTISVDADSGLTYDDISTQLVTSVESEQFTAYLNQYAVEQNVTQFASASTLSVETTDVTVSTDFSSSRAGGDALGSDAIVGIAIGFCALLFLSAYLGRLYVARRAARSSSSELAGKR